MSFSHFCYTFEGESAFTRSLFRHCGGGGGVSKGEKILYWLCCINSCSAALPLFDYDEHVIFVHNVHSCDPSASRTYETHGHRKWYHQSQKPWCCFEHDTHCTADRKNSWNRGECFRSSWALKDQTEREKDEDSLWWTAILFSFQLLPWYTLQV